MRLLCCMTAAMMLAAGVSARADVVGMSNVSGAVMNNIKVSDVVAMNTANGWGDFASAFSSPVEAVDQAALDSSAGAVCAFAELCDGSTGTPDTNASSALPLQAESMTAGAEPSSVALLGTGLLGFAAVMRRRFLA